jgi:hypothetical protein
LEGTLVGRDVNRKICDGRAPTEVISEVGEVEAKERTSLSRIHEGCDFSCVSPNKLMIEVVLLKEFSLFSLLFALARDSVKRLLA